MFLKSFIISCFFVSFIVDAQIKVPHFFSNHMVLQQNEPITIYGLASVGEKIEASFLNETLNTQADSNGNWSVTFKAAKAGGPFEVTLKGNNTITFSDVFVGEVWFCSGQSNMGWRLENSLNGQEELINANYEKIKLFNVPRYMSHTKENNISKSTWETCTSKNAEGFSAVAYFFGRSLYEKYQVPIGLINSSWGGTNIEAWMDTSLFKNNPKHLETISKMKTLDMVNLIKEYSRANKNYGKYLDKEDLGTKSHWETLKTDYSNWETFKLPSLWRDTDLNQTYGVVWVTKEINLEDSEISSDIQLSIGRIDNEDITYINGQLVGESTNKDLDRMYSVPKNLLKAGSNRITIRTKNLGDLGGFRGAESDLYLKTKNRKLSLIGNWHYKIGTPNIDEPPVREHPKNYPSSLFNSMVHPFYGYNIKGIIWYQGESNTNNPEEYATFFPEMINNWRKGWNKEVPFLFVQLANYANQGNKEAAIREAQTSALKLPKTAMVVTMDIGEDANVHFPNKQEVGKRLAMAAQNIAYGDKISKSGPMVKKIKIKKYKITITFDKQLVIKGEAQNINGFLISDDKENFTKATASLINKTTIEVSSKTINNPKYVRYLWEDAPGKVMIYNSANLPAPPFRTDK